MRIADTAEALRERATRMGEVSRQVTAQPLLVRAMVTLAALTALITISPWSVLRSGSVVVLLLAATLPALAPRSAVPSLFMFATVLVWLIGTGRTEAESSFGRIFVLALALYVVHFGCAVAAVLPYNAAVSPGVFGPLVLRFAVVAIITALLAGVILVIPVYLSGSRLVIATLGGLVLALTCAIYLSFLGIRRQWKP